MALRVDVSVDTERCILLWSVSGGAKITRHVVSYPRASARGVLESIELLANCWSEHHPLSETDPTSLPYARIGGVSLIINLITHIHEFYPCPEYLYKIKARSKRGLAIRST